MTKNLTEGSPIKIIFFLSIPLLIGRIFQQLYNIADTMIVGRLLGTNAMAAVGSTAGVSWLPTAALIGMTTGLSVVTAQQFGAGNEKGVKKTFAMSLLISAVISLVFFFIFFFSTRRILTLMNTPPELLRDAYSYALWPFAGIIATTFYNLFANMLRALGDSKTPVAILMISTIINIICDFVFIGLFKMGTAGAGAATFAAQIISAILCLIHIMRKVKILHISMAYMSFDTGIIKKLIHISFPMMFLNVVISMGVIIIQFVNNMLGTVYVAAYTAASKIENIIHQPIFAFGETVSVFTAQNFGAGKYGRIKQGVRQTTLIAFIWYIAGTIMMWMLGRYFIEVFVGSGGAEIVENGYLYIVINASLTFILTPLVIYKYALQALNRAFIPTLSGVAEVVTRGITSVLFANSLGFIGICFSNPAAWLGGLIPIMIDYSMQMKKLVGLEKKKQGEVQFIH